MQPEPPVAPTLSDPRVAAYHAPTLVYPDTPPFHPSAPYPEYPFTKLGPSNAVYEGVRELFCLLGMDADRFGTPAWNPLGSLVRPGDRVVVKPNFLWQSHKYRHDEWEQVITHGSVIRAVMDYVIIALEGRGEVCLADGPQLDADWDQIVARTGVGAVCAFYATQPGAVPVHLLDLRDQFIENRGDVLLEPVPLAGDPEGGATFDLAHRSRFVDHAGAGRYYGADYNQDETNRHHSGGRHEYRISATSAGADVFINLPKMKTHKKVGVTLCLKNLVGINSGRNWLPHHTDGNPSTRGDQFPTASVRGTSERWGIRNFQRLTLRYPKLFGPLFRMAKRIARPIWGHTEDVVRNGNWYGNDTCWRMVHDINRCLLYANAHAFPAPRPKRYFAVVDGVVAGDFNGPAVPERFLAGTLVAGHNPVAVDCVTTRIMGFDPQRLALLREAFAPSELPLATFSYEDIRITSNREGWHGSIADIRPESCFAFRPHFGWKGAIEWRGAPSPSEKAR
jgi:uncharacterized protein (DUF362 family)